MNPAKCIRANADASPPCTEQCVGCSFMQGTLEMLPLKENQILTLFKNRDFGSIHVQRFFDSEVRRVHVLDSTVCEKPKKNESGVYVVDPFVDVMTDAEIPAAIDMAWKKLQLLWYYGKFDHNDWGVFSPPPPPPHLEGVTAASLNLLAYTREANGYPERKT